MRLNRFTDEKSIRVKLEGHILDNINTDWHTSKTCLCTSRVHSGPILPWWLWSRVNPNSYWYTECKSDKTLTAWRSPILFKCVKFYIRFKTILIANILYNKNFVYFTIFKDYLMYIHICKSVIKLIQKWF